MAMMMTNTTKADSHERETLVKLISPQTTERSNTPIKQNKQNKTTTKQTPHNNQPRNNPPAHPLTLSHQTTNQPTHEPTKPPTDHVQHAPPTSFCRQDSERRSATNVRLSGRTCATCNVSRNAKQTIWTTIQRNNADLPSATTPSAAHFCEHRPHKKRNFARTLSPTNVTEGHLSQKLENKNFLADLPRRCLIAAFVRPREPNNCDWMVCWNAMTGSVCGG